MKQVSLKRTVDDLHRVRAADEVVVMTEVDADAGANATDVAEMTADAEASVVPAETKAVA